MPKLTEIAMAAPLLTTQDVNWDLERGTFNILIDQQPAGIALPRSADEVSDVVRSAAADGKRVAAQCTGHLAAPLGSLTDTVLLRTAGLERRSDRCRCQQCPSRRRRPLGRPCASGIRSWASPLLHGSAPGVGIAGYTLGGGVSFYARKHGLACNRVTAIELVTADGEQVRVDADNEPDLFWALRGGGGSFGVVTALEFDLLPMSRDLCRCPLLPRRAGERCPARLAASGPPTSQRK